MNHGASNTRNGCGGRRVRASRGVAVGRAGTRCARPWGDPDLQGVWTGSTLTPLERPARFAGQELLTEEQAAELELRADATRFVEREVREGDPGTYNTRSGSIRARVSWTGARP